MIIKSGLPSLKIRRMRNIALETFKILYAQNPSYLHDLVKFKHSTYNFRHKNTVHIPKPRTERYGKKSFKFTASKIWNSLPQSFRETSNFRQFSSLISSWDGPDCSCTSCKTGY